MRAQLALMGFLACLPLAPALGAQAEPGMAVQVTFGHHHALKPHLVMQVDYTTDTGMPASSEAGSPAELATRPRTDSAMKVPVQWTLNGGDDNGFALGGVTLVKSNREDDTWLWALGAGILAAGVLVARDPHDDTASEVAGRNAQHGACQASCAR